jgi:hypothetical protein
LNGYGKLNGEIAARANGQYPKPNGAKIVALIQGSVASHFFRAPVEFAQLGSDTL